MVLDDDQGLVADVESRRPLDATSAERYGMASFREVMEEFAASVLLWSILDRGSHEVSWRNEDRITSLSLIPTVGFLTWRNSDS